MMLPILACSVIGMTIVFERLLQFRGTGKTQEASQMVALSEKGKFTDALALADQHAQPLLRVLAAGIMNREELPDKAMEAAGLAELARLKRGLSVLDTIITLGPLLGLLGTIVGMIDSFGIMAESGLGQPHAVTGGIAEALICTAAGIFVAVTTLIPYNYFHAKVEQMTERIEQYATQLESALAAQVRHPHHQSTYASVEHQAPIQHQAP
ncbi:MAG: MotA/TolQ/ExbB proton channel family protein [Nitrospirales bacterium]|nr:MotA/TolQ/ExbB proton channel family protein [Nitrospira sp.]MDR4501847.1 MotA/TolQ/ExbB proton channel family protein [Nitrospirales bacterium]